MPGLSSANSVMPFLTQTALTLAEPSPGEVLICVPSSSGVCAAARDLLGFVVMQLAQQPRRRRRARIRAEHARHVRPDFQPLGAELRGKIRA